MTSHFLRILIKTSVICMTYPIFRIVTKCNFKATSKRKNVKILKNYYKNKFYFFYFIKKIYDRRSFSRHQYLIFSHEKKILSPILLDISVRLTPQVTIIICHHMKKKIIKKKLQK